MELNCRRCPHLDPMKSPCPIKTPSSREQRGPNRGPMRPRGNMDPSSQQPLDLLLQETWSTITTIQIYQVRLSESRFLSGVLTWILRVVMNIVKRFIKSRFLSGVLIWIFRVVMNSEEIHKIQIPVWSSDMEWKVYILMSCVVQYSSTLLNWTPIKQHERLQ